MHATTMETLASLAITTLTIPPAASLPEKKLKPSTGSAGSLSTRRGASGSTMGRLVQGLGRPKGMLLQATTRLFIPLADSRDWEISHQCMPISL